MPGTAKPRWASRGRISWTARVMVAGAGAGGAAAWVAAAGAQRALVGGGPRVGELGDQVAQVLPRQSGEDRMGEGRTGPWWSRHPRMMTVRPVPCATRCPRSTTAIAHQVVMRFGSEPSGRLLVDRQPPAGEHSLLLDVES